MIIKRIRSKHGIERFEMLLQYASLGDKLAWCLLGNVSSLEGAALQMQLTAFENPRVRKPCLHLVMSLSTADRASREPEKYTELVQSMARDVITQLGLAEHQWVALSHRDGLHTHVHFVINRVHPETYKPYSLSWDYPKMRRIARALEVQYDLLPTPPIKRALPLPLDEPRMPKRSLALVSRSGGPVMFDEWVGIVPRVNVVASLARGLDAFHAELAAWGLRYATRDGSGKALRGGVILDAFNPKYRADASAMARALSLPRLTALFGTLPDSPPTVQPLAGRSYSHTVRNRPAVAKPKVLLRRFETERDAMKAASQALRAKLWGAFNAGRRERTRLAKADHRQWLADLRTLPVEDRALQRELVRLAYEERKVRNAVATAEEREAIKERMAAEAPRPPTWKEFAVREAMHNDIQAVMYLAQLRGLGRRVAIVPTRHVAMPQATMFPDMRVSL